MTQLAASAPLAIGIEDVRSARTRIAGHVRRTPMLDVRPVRRGPALGGGLRLKLESLQVTGSFKPRGALNRALQMSRAELDRGLICASAGNHGLGVAYAGLTTGAKATIYIPENAPKDKAEKLRRWGASVVVRGAVWDDANAAAREACARDGMTFLHSFSDPAVIAGQGTVGLELIEDAPDTDTVFVAIGGGGLIGGIAVALKAVRPGIKVIGVQAAGAAALRESFRARRLVTLERVDTIAASIAPRRSEQANLDIALACVDDIVTVEDREIADAAAWLWFELGVAAEYGGATAIAPLLAGRYRPQADESLAAVVCGAGTDGMR